MRPGDGALLIGSWQNGALTDSLLEPILTPPRALRWLFWAAGAGTLVYFAAVIYTVFTGIGAWGNQVPVAWAFAIINFVWWIGIGHAGTFISAILLLLEQKWRTSINRIAEGMTLFALVQAGLMPLLHLGRPWFFYWLVPYPSTLQVWPQFMSPLTWDVAAVFTYATISVLFFYLGCIPDLATVRDRATSLGKRRVYGVFALGWQGTPRQWRHHASAQLLLAGLATPLVLSVHSIVGMDFSVAVLPGWHSLLFPPYFVAGALLSGFAMVAQLAVPVRRLYGLEHVITPRHFDLLGKMILLTAQLIAYAYVIEHAIAWYTGDEYERYLWNVYRPFGALGWSWWLVIACTIVAVQPLWFAKVRRSPWALFGVATVVQVGMWLERFMLVVTALARDFLPSSWQEYTPSVVDGAILAGSVSFFLFLFLLMLRWVPFIPIAESRELNDELKQRGAKIAPNRRAEAPGAARATG